MENNTGSDLVEIYQAKMTISSPGQEQKADLCCVGKFCITRDCPGIVRSDMMFPDFYHCLINHAQSRTTSIAVGKEGYDEWF